MRWSEPVDLGPDSRAAARRDRRGDRHGRRPRTSAATATTAVLTLPRGLEDGTYVVAWRVTSADSHPVSGAFSFAIGAAERAGHRGRAGRVERRRSRSLDGIARGVVVPRASRSRSAARACCCSCGPRGRASARGRRFLLVGAGRADARARSRCCCCRARTRPAAGCSARSSRRCCRSRCPRASGRRCSRGSLLTLAFAVLVARGAARPSRVARRGWARACVGLLADLDAHRPLADRRADVARACPRRPCTCWRWRCGSAGSRCCSSACSGAAARVARAGRAALLAARAGLLRARSA